MAQFQRGQSGNPAGRPKRTEKYAEQIGTLEDQMAASLPSRYAALDLLASGGFEQVSETWEPAGLIFRDEVLPGDDGKVIRTRVLAFPDKPADELVCIRRTRSVAAPDRRANEYLINRILGTPVQQIEGEIDAPEGGALDRFMESVAKIYGRGDGSDGSE